LFYYLYSHLKSMNSAAEEKEDKWENEASSRSCSWMQ
jgi:hypothetical protein